jgi:protein subunit release factor A
VTDHRINMTLHGIDELMRGGPPLDALLEALRLDEQQRAVAAMEGAGIA